MKNKTLSQAVRKYWWVHLIATLFTFGGWLPIWLICMAVQGGYWFLINKAASDIAGIVKDVKKEVGK